MSRRGGEGRRGEGEGREGEGEGRGEREGEMGSSNKGLQAASSSCSLFTSGTC